MVGARAFDVLCVLVDHAGELVTKKKLFDVVWPGLVVEENNLQVHVSSLRRILGADAIATVPSRGYRFTLRLATSQTETNTVAPVLPKTLAADVQAYRRTIAVLPFVNLNADPDQEYFSDGLAEDIISYLTKSPWLLVVSRNSSFAYRNTTESNQAVGSALRARYLVLGSVRRAGNRLRITGQLIDGLSGNHLWAEKFDRDADVLGDDARTHADECGDHRDHAAEQQAAAEQPAQAEHRVLAITAPHRVPAYQHLGRQLLPQRIGSLHAYCLSPRNCWPACFSVSAITLPAASRSKRISAPTASITKTSRATACTGRAGCPVPWMVKVSPCAFTASENAGMSG